MTTHLDALDMVPENVTPIREPAPKPRAGLLRDRLNDLLPDNLPKAGDFVYSMTVEADGGGAVIVSTPGSGRVAACRVTESGNVHLSLDSGMLISLPPNTKITWGRS